MSAPRIRSWASPILLSVASVSAFTLALVAAAGCENMRRLALELPAQNGHVSSEAPQETAAEPTSSSRSSQEVADAAGDLLPGAEHVRSASVAGKQVLLGYVRGEETPRMAASLLRVGDSRGNLVLGVGVEKSGEGGRISRVLTYAPQGRLHGIARYEEVKGAFLARFAGRDAADELRDVDAVSGATAICETVREVVAEEAAWLAALLHDENALQAVAAAARAPLADPGRAARQPGGGTVPPEGSAPFDLATPAIAGLRGAAPAGSPSVVALYVEIFLFAAVVGVVILREARRKR